MTVSTFPCVTALVLCCRTANYWVRSTSWNRWSRMSSSDQQSSNGLGWRSHMKSPRSTAVRLTSSSESLLVSRRRSRRWRLPSPITSTSRSRMRRTKSPFSEGSAIDWCRRGKRWPSRSGKRRARWSTTSPSTNRPHQPFSYTRKPKLPMGS